MRGALTAAHSTSAPTTASHHFGAWPLHAWSCSSLDRAVDGCATSFVIARGKTRSHDAKRANVGAPPVPAPSYFSSLDRRRSASGLPPVWQVGQYCSDLVAK